MARHVCGMAPQVCGTIPHPYKTILHVCRMVLHVCGMALHVCGTDLHVCGTLPYACRAIPSGDGMTPYRWAVVSGLSAAVEHNPNPLEFWNGLNGFHHLLHTIGQFLGPVIFFAIIPSRIPKRLGWTHITNPATQHSSHRMVIHWPLFTRPSLIPLT
jgi:hypothetical protein